MFISHSRLFESLLWLMLDLLFAWLHLHCMWLQFYWTDVQTNEQNTICYAALLGRSFICHKEMHNLHCQWTPAIEFRLMHKHLVLWLWALSSWSSMWRFETDIRVWWAWPWRSSLLLGANMRSKLHHIEEHPNLLYRRLAELAQQSIGSASRKPNNVSISWL